ncbi:MAG: hypothetical protein C0469_04195 [Cyanobacteria bacterium DS2.3.42]|nr:hypothetical protein [Cyanobacteria bacterium DS2.3.42]
MKRILAASLSLIGFTTSTVYVLPGNCQGGAIQANTTKVNSALPGGKRPTNSNVGGVNANIGGVNTNIGGVNANGPKLNGPGSQSQLNPGRVGDQLGGIQDTLNTGLSGFEQSITDKIGVSKVKATSGSGAPGPGASGSQGSGSVDNRPLQDKLTDVGQQQAADALGQDPNGNFAGTGTPNPGTTGGTAAGGQGSSAGGSTETGATGGGDSSGNSGSSGGDSGRGNRNTGEGSGDTGHTTETGHGSRPGGDSIFEHPTTGQAGAVSAPGSNIHIEQENVGNVNANIGDNLQNAAGALRNGAVEGLGSQLNGVEVRSLKGGGGGLPGGARNVSPNLNNRLPGAGTAGASGLGGINANVGVGAPNVGVGTGAKLDIGRGALGNQNVGNINSQLNQIKDVAAGAISDGRPSDRGVVGGGGPVGGQVPPAQGQGGSVPGSLGNSESGAFGNPNPPGIFDTGKGIGGADGVVDFVPDANNNNTNGGDSGSFGNPNNAGGTGSTGGGSTQSDPRTPAGTGDHSTTGHTEGTSGSGSSSSSGSGSSGGSSETGHTTETGHGSRPGGDGIFEHPTTGQAGAVSAPGSNIHIEQENIGNVNANVGGNLQNRAGALRNGAVEGLGSQLNGVEVRSFKSDGGGASAVPGGRTGSGFGSGVSPFAPGGKFSGVAAPVSLPGAGANTSVLGGTGIVSPRNLPGVGGKVGGATLPGASGRAPLGNVSGVGGTTLNVPKINPNSAIYIKITDIAPRSLNTGAGAVRPNLPNFSGGAGSIKITPNLNLNTGGSTPSRGGSVVSPTQRTQQNITRPTLVAPTRR